MTTPHPADDARPAAWLLHARATWWDLVRFGVPGFAVYLRVPVDPVGPEQLDLDCSRTALEVLAGHTSTPATGYGAVWDGNGLGPSPDAPRVPVPHRPMFLLTGPVRTLRATHRAAWQLDSDGPEPDLAWPADHAWCLACDVDEEVEFTIGCSEAAARDLEAALPGLVRRVAYGDDVPLLRDDS